MDMQPTEDERVLAALSHASIVANVVNLAGMIGTALIWATQRDRSPYVRTQALQALVYQGAVLLIAIFLTLSGSICMVLSLLPVILRPDLYRASPPSYTLWIGVLGLLMLVGFGILATLYGLYGAYQVYRGRPFRYLVIGRLVRPLPAADSAPPPAVVLAAAAAPAANSVPTPAVDPPAEAAPTQPDAAPATPPPLQEPPATGAAPVGPKRRGRRPSGDEEP
jgi:uncharacterized Tic20 family protein